MSWDDLRFVLAMADHGSVNAAARALGVTHATVLRRVASFETAQGGAVFDRGPGGYSVRQDRQRVIDAAREVANAVGAVDRVMHGATAPVRGRVRISSTDSFCRLVLPGAVKRLHAVAPELKLDLLSSNQHLDIARLQTDITVRPTPELPDDMTGEIAADLVFYAYAAPGSRDAWLGLEGPVARSAAARWIETNIPKDRIHCASDSFLVIAELARLKLGIAALPAFVGDATPGLERCEDLMPAQSIPLWTATHVDLSDSPRIRLARRYLTEYLRDCAPWLAGKA